MKKKIVTIVVVVLLLVVAALAVCYFMGVFNTSYIGKPAAQAAALEDAGVAASEVTRVHVDFEKEDGYAWYEVQFVKSAIEYEYKIDALNGQVVDVKSESVFD